jgi:hypothetical protein
VPQEETATGPESFGGWVMSSRSAAIASPPAISFCLVTRCTTGTATSSGPSLNARSSGRCSRQPPVSRTTSGFVLGADGPIRVERLITSVYRISADGGSAEAVASLPWLEQVIAPSGGVRPDGSEVIGRSHRAFGRSSWVVADAEGWIFADNTAPEIEVRAIDGSLTRIIRWPAEPRLVTHEDIQRDAEWSFASSSRQEPAVRERVRRAREAHPAPPDTMPWFGCAPTPSCPGRPVLLDTDRNLWVQEYRPPAEGLSNRYEVFDSAGVWLGAVTMPADLEVLSIAYDHVVGVVRDDLDVESVAVYAIEKS